MEEKRKSQGRSIADFCNILLASGRIPGFFREWKFGRNAGVDGKADLWSGGGVYPFYDTNRNILINSSHVDDNPSSTGAYSVEVYGLGIDWKLQREKVILAGLTPVKTKLKYIRVFRGEIKKAGSAGENIGTIYFKDESEGIVRAQIDPADNQTLMAVYTIPRDHTGYLVRYFANFTGQTPVTILNVELRIRLLGEVFRIQDPVGLQDNMSYIAQPYEIPLGPFPQKTDIKLQVSSNQSADVRGGFLLVLERGGGTFFQKDLLRK